MSARSFDINKTTKQSNVRVIGGLDCIVVKLHDTIVFTLSAGIRIYLSSGGYRTLTTKTAINRAFAQTRPEFSVFQKKGQWFVSDRKNNVEIPFVDGMIINF